jgi:hypothetical protein
MTATADLVQCDHCQDLEDELQTVLEGVIDAKGEIEARLTGELQDRVEAMLEVALTRMFKRAFEMGYTYARTGEIRTPTGQCPPRSARMLALA